jgi:hypothetical protein
MRGKPFRIMIVAGLLGGCEVGRIVQWQTPSPDDRSVPAPQREAYREDAARLALRHLLRLGSGPADQVEIPDELSNDLYQRLVLVYNARDLAARDSVVDLYAVHTFPYPTTRSLLVFVAKGAGWPDAWRRGEPRTGNDAVDGLMVRYGLDLERCTVLIVLRGDMCVLAASRPLNVGALALLFARVEGVESSAANGPGGDGDDLDAARESDAWRLEYTVKWGDCLGGCITSHRWTFRVRDDGVVEYVGGAGPPPPPPGNRGP